ncbi:hypothetical protein EV421DRAFT_1745400 [Armillaria borealis]|uniref:Uncharacterized protein n=1 Tax=Armillaria borealis TaxID=47425 RepID=A0AA39ITI5_9AGAR|nr:hypothetical protein EV421DRAFT_1745400 [Armillaria borealis]
MSPKTSSFLNDTRPIGASGKAEKGTELPVEHIRDCISICSGDGRIDREDYIDIFGVTIHKKEYVPIVRANGSFWTIETVPSVKWEIPLPTSPHGFDVLNGAPSNVTLPWLAINSSTVYYQDSNGEMEVHFPARHSGKEEPSGPIISGRPWKEQRAYDNITKVCVPTNFISEDVGYSLGEELEGHVRLEDDDETAAFALDIFGEKSKSWHHGALSSPSSLQHSAYLSHGCGSSTYECKYTLNCVAVTDSSRKRTATRKYRIMAKLYSRLFVDTLCVFPSTSNPDSPNKIRKTARSATPLPVPGFRPQRTAEKKRRPTHAQRYGYFTDARSDDAGKESSRKNNSITGAHHCDNSP